MKFQRSMLALGVAALPLALAAPAQADHEIVFTLAPLNDSGAEATATVAANEDGSLGVSIQGTGFTPNQPHAQHIHGAIDDADFFCPPPSADADGDGFVATEEGVPQYGDVLISLTTTGDVSADSGLAIDRFPVADAEGNLDYERTLPAEMLPEGLAESLTQLHIVQHGIDVNGNDTYDLESLGESVFAASLGVKGVPEEATNPATCGEVTPAGGVETGAGGTSGPEQLPLMALGGLALLGAGGAVLARRRLAPADAA